MKAESERALAARSEKAPKEPTKRVTLKSASDPAVKEKADAVLGKATAAEKAPHPRAGRTESQKAPKGESDDDLGAKAPHGNLR